eukprot:m.107286 g.107286  ORF g.107286 m.107286 type:complete len:305 (+) comp13321_c2_seq4:215-1129(+)
MSNHTHAGDGLDLDGATEGPNKTQLLLMSAAMFAGAFGAGYLPFLVSLSPAKLRYVTVLGVGLLLGTALIVIVPEGVHMWASSFETAHHDHEPEHEHEHEHGEGHGHNAQTHPPHWELGALLALGFALMLVVDKLGGGFGHSHGTGPSSGNGSAGSSGNGVGSVSPSTSTSPLPTSMVKAEVAPPQTSTVFGLMIHAAVDGVALGASCFMGGMEASLLIFVAIMLHKGPAAFGLSVFLTSVGYRARAVKQSLLIFSLAAPVRNKHDETCLLGQVKKSPTVTPAHFLGCLVIRDSFYLFLFIFTV